MLAVFALVWVGLAIRPLERGAWLLENILTVIAVPLAVTRFRRFRFSDRAYVQATAFLLLHTIGSHYTYSRTPLGDLASAVFGLSRNHYDRAVHFAFGLLMLSACRELFFRPPAQVPLRRQLGFSIAFIAAFSGAYEAVEWITAIAADPAAGIAFLGTQGDVWDAQKDFVCAVVGALLGCTIETRALRSQLERELQREVCMTMRRALQVILGVGLFGVAFSGTLSYQELFTNTAEQCPAPGPAGTVFGYPACVYGLFMYMLISAIAAWGLRSGRKVTARESGQRTAIPSARALRESTAQPGTES